MHSTRCESKALNTNLNIKMPQQALAPFREFWNARPERWWGVSTSTSCSTFSQIPWCAEHFCLLLHFPTFCFFQLSAATERRSPNVSMKTFQGFNSPDFGLSQKTEARSRMAALKHSHAQTVLSGLLFLFEHTVYPRQAASLMYLSHSWALASPEMKLKISSDFF